MGLIGNRVISIGLEKFDGLSLGRYGVIAARITCFLTHPPTNECMNR